MIKIENDKIKCPKCGSKVFADIYETWSDTQLPTEDGFHVLCSDDWKTEPCEITYDEGLQLHSKVYQWLILHMRKLPV